MECAMRCTRHDPDARPNVPILSKWNKEMQGPKPKAEEQVPHPTKYDPNMPKLSDRWSWSGINDPR
jgi:hypothetical protein